MAVEFAYFEFFDLPDEDTRGKNPADAGLRIPEFICVNRSPSVAISVFSAFSASLR